MFLFFVFCYTNICHSNIQITGEYFLFCRHCFFFVDDEHSMFEYRRPCNYLDFFVVGTLNGIFRTFKIIVFDVKISNSFVARQTSYVERV